MVIVLMGSSCVGKSTIAELLRQQLSAELIGGKDYLRLARSESAAKALFQEKLRAAMAGEAALIYVITEKELLPLLPEGCLRVLVTAPLPQIRERFARRMHGQLPAPVAAMLERKYGEFDAEPHALHIDTAVTTPEDAVAAIMATLAAGGAQ